MSHVTCEWAMSHMNKSRLMWAVSHMNVSCYLWTRHVTYECVSLSSSGGRQSPTRRRGFISRSWDCWAHQRLHPRFVCNWFIFVIDIYMLPHLSSRVSVSVSVSVSGSVSEVQSRSRACQICIYRLKYKEDLFLDLEIVGCTKLNPCLVLTLIDISKRLFLRFVVI